VAVKLPHVLVRQGAPLINFPVGAAGVNAVLAAEHRVDRSVVLHELRQQRSRGAVVHPDESVAEPGPHAPVHIQQTVARGALFDLHCVARDAVDSVADNHTTIRLGRPHVSADRDCGACAAVNGMRNEDFGPLRRNRRQREKVPRRQTRPLRSHPTGYLQFTQPQCTGNERPTRAACRKN
jgi:hypothetical protein